MVDTTHGDLADVVSARHPASGFACGLNGRQEQSDQDPDDCDHDQQLYEGKTVTGRSSSAAHVSLSGKVPGWMDIW
jgi:hypothetical protein